MTKSHRFIAQVAGRATGIMALTSLLGACAPEAPQEAAVVWHLADGRSCVDTAVVQVTIEVEGGAMTSLPTTGPCHAHPSENQFTLKGLIAGAKLHARALSAQEAVLYRGELRLADPVPLLIELPLYYTGGE